LGENGKLNMLQQDMISLEKRINYLNQIIPALAAMTGLGILMIFISALAILTNAPGGIIMLIAGIATTATGGGLLGQSVEEKKDKEHTYQETVVEFEHLQTRSLSSLASPAELLFGLFLANTTWIISSKWKSQDYHPLAQLA
jgi:hypothetical protein